MTRSTARTLQREATRRDLVSAGLKLVASNGFAGMTTAAVAQATGRAHGTVFVHFKTREQLVAALVAEVGRTISERLAGIGGDEHSLIEVLDAHLMALRDSESLYARLLGEAASLPHAARAHVFALQSGVAWRVRTAYLRERERGSVREVDPVLLSNTWIALTNHYLVNRDLFAEDESVIARHGDALREFLLQMIRLEGAPR